MSRPSVPPVAQRGATAAAALALALLVNLALLTAASRLTVERALHLDITAPAPVRLVRWSPPPERAEQEPPPVPETPPEPTPPPPAADLSPLLPSPPPLDLPAALPPSGVTLPAPAGSGLPDALPAAALDRPPAVLVRLQPEYPLAAREGLVEGYVRVRFLVTPDGRAERVTVVEARPPGVFERAVLDALPAWRFQPGLLAGRAVPAWMETTVRFELTP